MTCIRAAHISCRELKSEINHGGPALEKLSVLRHSFVPLPQTAPVGFDGVVTSVGDESSFGGRERNLWVRKGSLSTRLLNSLNIQVFLSYLVHNLIFMSVGTVVLNPDLKFSFPHQKEWYCKP